MDEILVAVDGSNHSLRVVDYACQIAKGLSANILLVYVMHLPRQEPEEVSAFEKSEQYPDAFSEYLQDLSEDVTSKLSERISQAGIESRSVTPTGNPSAEIIDIAEIEKVKMIVLGVKGLHGIARIRSLGSIARRVIENSSKPVLVIP